MEDFPMPTIPRRTFLKETAAAAAVASSIGSWAAANDRVNVGVIGLRNRGNGDAKDMIESGHFNIVSACDCDLEILEERQADLAEKQGRKPKAERDFRKVLEDPEVDAVIVGTPDHWHAMMTVMALDAGKHVFLEKPASFNIEDGKAIVAAQEKHPNLVVAIGTQQRSGAHFHEAKKFIDEGGLGKIAFVRTCKIGRRDILEVIPDSEPPEVLDYDMWLGPAPKRPYNQNRVHYNWRFMRDYGTGETGNWGAHWVDVAAWFLNLDFPKSASGLGGIFVVHDAKEWPDTETVIFEYPEQTLVWEQRIWSRFGVGGGIGGGVEISGEKGAMTISRGGWTFYPIDKEQEEQKHEGSELDIAHVTNFAKAVRGEEKANATAMDGHKAATICHLANITATLNRRIEIDPKSQTIVGDEEAARMAGREYRAPWSLAGFI
jgi:predicted dehydrogenase